VFVVGPAGRPDHDPTTTTTTMKTTTTTTTAAAATTPQRKTKEISLIWFAGKA
jgi:hypothetical protein